MSEKKKLQDDYPHMKFGTAKECIDILGWKYVEKEKRLEDITCDCGALIKLGGWFGTEQLWCPSCGKGM